MLAQVVKSPGSYASYYPPLKWSVQQGYVEEIKGPNGSRYQATAAGRAAHVKAQKDSTRE